LARNIKKKLKANDYLVKCRSPSLTVYNNEFILDSARIRALAQK